MILCECIFFAEGEVVFSVRQIVWYVLHCGHNESERDLIFPWKMSLKKSLPFKGIVMFYWKKNQSFAFIWILFFQVHLQISVET